MPVRLLLPQLAAACLFLSCGPARGAEWVLDRSVSARITHNDNFNMLAVNPVAETYLTLTPSLSLKSRTESRSVELTASAGINRHFKDKSNDTIDQNLGAALKLTRELNQFSVTVARLRDSTLNSELAQTGVVTVRRQRTQNSVQAAWLHNYDERTTGNLALGAAQVRYEPGPGLVDYDDRSMSIGLRRVLDERGSLTARVISRDYRTVTGDSRTRTLGVSFGGQWQYSERLGLNIEAGRQRTRSDETLKGLICPFGLPPCLPVEIDIRTETTEPTYSGSLGYALESGSVAANLSRSLTASGSGSLLRTDSGGLSYSHRFTDALGLNLGGTLTQSGNLRDLAATDRYASLSASMIWQIDQWLTLSGGLTHSTQRAAGQREDTRANVVFLNLNWGFAPLSRSR